MVERNGKIKGIKINERKSGTERFICLGDFTPALSLKKGEGDNVDNLDESFFD
jgi:hypothetical protein